MQNLENQPKEIYGFKMHEGKMYKGFTVLRVPGGWIYRFGIISEGPLSTVFVPYSNEFKPYSNKFKPKEELEELM